MRAPGRLSAMALAAAAAGGGALASGCGVAGSAFAPVSVLPATDVAVETNLQTNLTVVRAAEAAGTGVSTAAEPGFVSGASTAPGETSFAQPSPAVAVLAAYNDVTRDCLGIALLSATPPAPVLGRSAPGTYYFVQHSTPTGGCAAASFAAQTAVPSGWPAGDPSSTGFPGA